MKAINILGFIFLIAISTLVSASPAAAQDMKIGFVEPRIILDRMPEMRAVQQRLQNFAERKQNELIAKERDLQSEIELFQQRASVISEQRRQEEEERLTQLRMDLLELENRTRQEIREQQANLMSPLLQQIQDAIDTVAARKGLDYVLNTSTSTADVIILYVSPQVQAEYDITDEVMIELGI